MDNLDYDNLEGFMAEQLGWLSRQYREEVQFKRDLCEYFNVDIKFEYENKDMQIIISEKLFKSHPIFGIINNYEWATVSNNTNGIIFFSNKILIPPMFPEVKL